MKIYLVGGCVRDKLLGLPIKDRDWVVVGASAAELIDKGYQQVGKDFPVFLHPDSKEEYALARTERKTAPGYAGFEFTATADVSLEDDLKRRDLTINAIAATADGEIIDPLQGQRDIEQRLLRHVSSAFSEDPVRILRVARFAARFAEHGFTVAAETMQLMQEMVENGEVDAWYRSEFGKRQPLLWLKTIPRSFLLYCVIVALWPGSFLNSKTCTAYHNLRNIIPKSIPVSIP